MIVDAKGDESSFQELASLVKTAGGNIIGELIQKNDKRSAKFFLSSGKVSELKEKCIVNKAGLVVLNGNPSPSQVRNLEEELNVKVIDREGIILDIFAQRARTKEAKVQTELALLYYLLPRLIGKTELSRLGGGIGTRGPGEQKLEYDKRRIKKRISNLKKQLGVIKKERQVQRKKRCRDFLVCSIIGYTNAGKSTLLSSLCRSDLPTSPSLFTTIDPLSRKVRILEKDIIFTDTVGFIQDIPLSLSLAFKATIEEICYSDILLHVVDVSHPRFRDHMACAEKILEELNVANYPRITAFNKIDLLADRAILSFLKRETPNSVELSLLKGEGLDNLFKLLIKITYTLTNHRPLPLL